MSWNFANEIKREFKEDLEQRRKNSERNNDQLVDDITSSLKYMGGSRF